MNKQTESSIRHHLNEASGFIRIALERLDAGKDIAADMRVLSAITRLNDAHELWSNDKHEPYSDENPPF